MLRHLYYSVGFVHAVLYPFVLIRRRLIKIYARSSETVCRRLSELSESDIFIRVDNFAGTFRLSATSHLLHRVLLTGSYEPELAEIARSRVDPSRDAIDVGANVGFFTVLLAKQLNGGRVLAIEPTRSALQRLHHNVAANDVQDAVVVFEGLAASGDGELKVKTFVGLDEYSTAGVVDHFAVRGIEPILEQVTTATIDSLVRLHQLCPGFVKIDVEGFEMEVLKGAERTLIEHRPIVLAELTDSLLRKNGASAAAVIEFLRAHDYIVQDPLFPRLPPGRREYGDILAIPRS